MLIWSKQAFNKKGVLQVTDDVLEEFAYAQLKDYKKDYFKNPHPLDVDDFIENYLHIKTEYQKLSPNKTRYGTTAITDGLVPVVADDTGEFEWRFFKSGTIGVDLDACKNDDHIINFTLCHEAGHSQFHLHVDKDLLDGNGNYLDDTVIMDGRIYKKRTDRGWMEYHASKYASFILMPAKFVKKLYKIKHDEIMPGQRLGVRQKKLIWKMIYAIANELNVSATAMAWRMLSLDIISKPLFDALEMNNYKKEDTNMK